MNDDLVPPPVRIAPSSIAAGAIGSRLRHLLDTIEADIAALEHSLGLADCDYRPRFSPVMRLLADGEARSVRAIAAGIGVTHSAASQTVAQLERRNLVLRKRGEDGRERLVRISPQGVAVLPAIEAEWTATMAAIADLDRELPVPLVTMVDALEAALARRPLGERFPQAPVDGGQEHPTTEPTRSQG